ncbi:hypothetical protein Vretimale_12189, partial [Volvox reticuliferus]
MESCPVCSSPIPIHLLESHVNQHFDEAPNAYSRREPNILTASCTICGASVPLTQLDAHERGHESAASRHRRIGGRGGGGGAGGAPAAAPPSPPTSSSSVILMSESNLPDHDEGAVSSFQGPAADGSTRGPRGAPGAAFPTGGTSAAALDLTAAAPPPPPPAVTATPCVPSIICPYGCGQWIPVSELDSHELAHRMAGPPQVSSAATAAAAASRVPRSAAGEDEDWMEMGFDDTDYSYGDDVLDDAVAAAVAAEEEDARRQREEQDFEALRAKYGFSGKAPQRSGRCFTCGQEGHWSMECPNRPGRAPPTAGTANGTAATATAVTHLSIVPAELTRQQRPDPQTRRGGG